CRGNALVAQRGNKFASAGLDWHTVMAAIAHDYPATPVKERIGEGHAIGVDEEAFGVVVARSDHAAMDIVGHLEAQLGADIKDDGLEDDLCVEERAVHVEDGGLERAERSQIGKQR